MVAGKVANLSDGQHSSANLQSTSFAEAAEMLNVSERLVNAAKKVQNNATLEVVAAVEDGTVTVSDTAKVGNLPANHRKFAVETRRNYKYETLRKYKWVAIAPRAKR